MDDNNNPDFLEEVMAADDPDYDLPPAPLDEAFLAAPDVMMPEVDDAQRASKRGCIRKEDLQQGDMGGLAAAAMLDLDEAPRGRARSVDTLDHQVGGAVNDAVVHGHANATTALKKAVEKVFGGEADE